MIVLMPRFSRLLIPAASGWAPRNTPSLIFPKFRIPCCAGTPRSAALQTAPIGKHAKNTNAASQSFALLLRLIILLRLLLLLPFLDLFIDILRLNHFDFGALLQLIGRRHFDDVTCQRL